MKKNRNSQMPQQTGSFQTDQNPSLIAAKTFEDEAERESREYLQKNLDQMSFMDDKFSRYAFNTAHGKSLCEELIHVYTGKKAEIVKWKTQEHLIHSPQADAKEGVVDIVCEDKNHNQYIIELENNTPTAADAVNRLLYYSASIMITTIKAGQGYDNLKEICGMMVTKKDLFGEGQSQYRLEICIVVGNDKKLLSEYPDIGTPLRLIFANLDKEDQSKEACLTRDLFEPDPRKILSPVLSETMKNIKGKEKENMHYEFSDRFKEAMRQNAEIVAAQVAAKVTAETKRSQDIISTIIAYRDCGVSDEIITEKLKAKGYTEQEIKEKLQYS